VGSAVYRDQVIRTRKINSDQTHQIPTDINIAKNGTTVCILGAHIGNSVDQIGVWAPTLEKISRQLTQWSKSHSIQNGHKLVISMVVGGLTQFLTRVQDMPVEIEKIINKQITSFM